MITALCLHWGNDLTACLADEARRQYRVTFHPVSAACVHRMVLDSLSGETLSIPVEAWNPARTALIEAARVAVDRRSVTA